jgi:hypothetical protein
LSCRILKKNPSPVSCLRLRSTLSAAEASCRASAAATEAASLVCKAFCKIAQKMPIHYMGVTAAKLKRPPLNKVTVETLIHRLTIENSVMEQSKNK